MKEDEEERSSDGAENARRAQKKADSRASKNGKAEFEDGRTVDRSKLSKEEALEQATQERPAAH